MSTAGWQPLRSPPSFDPSSASILGTPRSCAIMVASADGASLLGIITRVVPDLQVSWQPLPGRVRAADAALITSEHDELSFVLACLFGDGRLAGAIVSSASESEAAPRLCWTELGVEDLAWVQLLRWDAERFGLLICGGAGISQRWVDVRGDYLQAPEGEELVAPVAHGRPSWISWGPRRYDLFMRSPEGEMLHKWRDDSPDRWDHFGDRSELHSGHLWWPPGVGWLPSPPPTWERIGPGLTSDIHTVAWPERRLDMLARGSRGQLVHKWWEAEVSWMPSVHEFEDLGGVLSEPPVIAELPERTFAVLGRSVDGTFSLKSHDVIDGWWPSRNGWLPLLPPTPDASLLGAISTGVRAMLVLSVGEGGLFSQLVELE
jgi:hypothetical protein